MQEKLRQSEYFDAVAYRDPMHPVVSAYADPKIEFIRQHVSLTGQILDVGCGNGIFTLRLVNAAATVTGLDYSPEYTFGPSLRRCNDAAFFGWKLRCGL
jgi:2-polyprenyl-3-methyl-5-hydroxy-6-metoxy-1,4-benzoquinol methylase